MDRENKIPLERLLKPGVDFGLFMDALKVHFLHGFDVNERPIAEDKSECDSFLELIVQNGLLDE